MVAPVADSYKANSGDVIAGGRFRLGALTDALSGLNRFEWLDWSSATNVRGITDIGPDGVAINWLETAGGYTLTNWPGKAAYDAARKQVVLVGTAQGYASEVPAGTHGAAVYFDLSTGLFTKQWNPMGVNLAHVYDGNCSVSLNGKTYRKPYNIASLYECDLSSRVWSLKKSLTALSLDAVTNIEVFPTLGASGSVLFLTGGGKLCRYDVATDALSTIGTYSGIGPYAWLHYCPAGDYVVFGSGNSAASIYKIDTSYTVTLITSSLPGALTGTGAGAGIPAVPSPDGARRSWIFAANAWALEHDTGTWTDRGEIPAGLAIAFACPCAIHGHSAFVFLEGAGRESSTVSNSQVWIFKV